MAKANKTRILVITEGPFLSAAAFKILEDIAYTHVNLQYFGRDEEDELVEIPATKVAGFIPEGLYERTPKAEFHQELCKALGYVTDTNAPTDTDSDGSDGTQDDLTDEDGTDFATMTVEELDEFCTKYEFTVSKNNRKTIGKYRKSVAAAYAALED